MARRWAAFQCFLPLDSISALWLRDSVGQRLLFPINMVCTRLTSRLLIVSLWFPSARVTLSGACTENMHATLLLFHTPLMISMRVTIVLMHMANKRFTGKLSWVSLPNMCLLESVTKQQKETELHEASQQCVIMQPDTVGVLNGLDFQSLVCLVYLYHWLDSTALTVLHSNHIKDWRAGMQ